MKSISKIILICLSLIAICEAQTIELNSLNGPQGGLMREFILNNQGEIYAEEEGGRSWISRDGGDSWENTTMSGVLSLVTHPDGSFYGAAKTSIHKIPTGQTNNEVTVLGSAPINPLHAFAIDEEGIFYATTLNSNTNTHEIYFSNDQGDSWTFIRALDWGDAVDDTKIITPKNNDYIYFHINEWPKEYLYRMKKDGSELELTYSPIKYKIIDISYDPSVGFLLLEEEQVYQSVDGSPNSWNLISSGLQSRGITCTSDGIITFGGKDGYYRTSDLGITWVKLLGHDVSPNLEEGWFKIEYNPVFERYIIRNTSSLTYNLFSVSPDFADWKTITPINSKPYIGRVLKDGAGNIYAGSSTSLNYIMEGWHRSTDDGNTFEPFRLPNDVNIRVLDEGANDALFAYGFNDTLYKSTDYGVSWTLRMPSNLSIEPNKDPRRSYVKAHPNGTVIVNFQGAIQNKLWLSKDNGDSWTLLDTREYYEDKIDIHPSGDIYGSFQRNFRDRYLVKYDHLSSKWDTVFYQGGDIGNIVVSETGEVYANAAWRGSSGLILSEDEGNTFVGTNRISPNRLTVAPNGYLLASNSSNDLILSKNKGLSWEIIYPNIGNINHFYFDENNYLYVSYNGAFIHKSSQFIFNDNFIVGNVFFDKNETCVFDDDDEFVQDIIVSAEGVDTFYVTTRSDGQFIIPVPAGSYDVKIISLNQLWEACDSFQVATLSGVYDTTFIDFGIKAIKNCPNLNVDLTTDRLRRCFENNYHVRYYNEGTSEAKDALIEITLDSRFTITSSDIPWSSAVGSSYTFPIGDVGIFDYGQFKFTVEMDCDSVDLGETICAEARITPDSICLNPDLNWSGASLQVTGECQGDSMIFIIKNVGAGDMIQGRQYIVIEDVAIMSVAPPITLAAGGTKRIAIEALGQTVHVEIPQVEGHPGLSAPSATLERCGNPFQTGLFNQFGQNDLGNAIDIECREITGAYDPNDKQAVPTGRDEEHFIQPNSTIEYLIRFQNTGTDTAFNVFILDTISNWLDIATLDVGAGSHDYEYEIYENGILRFDFRNIMLPDSNINQLGSNGFIKYKIKLKEDAPLGSVIYNAADIYFDFNDPIYTNQTYHTIEKPFVTVKTQEVFIDGAQVNVFPNPFNEQANFELKNAPFGEKQFNLFSLSGKKMRSQSFDEQRFRFQRDNLPAGIYFYEILTNGRKIVAGKLVVQ